MKPAFFLALLAASLFANGLVIIQGTIYDYSLKPVPGIVYVNSTPPQTVVAANGSYLLELEPGAYLITAVARSNESTTQAVVATRDGTYHLDLVVLDDTGALGAAHTAGALAGGELFGLFGPLSGAVPPWLAIILLCAIGATGWFLVNKRHGNGETMKAEGGSEPTPAPSAGLAQEGGGDLADGERELLALLEKQGGVSTQKELRKNFSDWSEARVSMLLTSLEERGKVVKIKKGRGNVVRLRQNHPTEAPPEGEGGENN